MKNPNWRHETGKRNAPLARAARLAKLTIDRRFWNRISYEPNSGCWLWEGAIGSHGYGTIGINSKAILVHRFSYELHNGPIPTGKVIDHHCTTRACCNPAHMEVVTYGENTRRGYERNPYRRKGGGRPVTARAVAA